MPYCQECGVETSPGDRYCPECGAKLDDFGGASATPGSGGEHVERGHVGRDADGIKRDRAGRVYLSAPSSMAGGRASLHYKGSLDFALSYPVANGWGAVIKGGLLVFLSFLFVPILPVVGQGYQLSRAAATGRGNPPRMRRWGDLIASGIIFTAIYVFVDVILILLRVAASRVHVVAYVVVLILSAYLFPAALTIYVGVDDFQQAFASRLPIDFAFSWFYFKSFVLYLLLFLAFTILAVVAAITIVGLLLVPFVVALQLYVMGAYWGHVYYRGAQEGVVPPPTPDPYGDDRTASRTPPP